MISLAAFALAGCIAISPGADQIVAGDLARADPAFAQVPPDEPVSFAPAPGVKRIFRAGELRRLAVRFHMPETPAGPLCIERAVSKLDSARLLSAMQKELPNARIEILDFNHQPAPQGEIRFPLQSLRPAQSAGFWNGFILYGKNRRFAIWARVKILVIAPRVVATEELKLGKPVEAAQLRLETREEFPTSNVFAQSIDEVAGRIPRCSIPVGTEIRTSLLETPKDIERGDTVRVEVKDGGALLELDALAEASGSAGDKILLRNPQSKKQFMAVVEGKGKASVTRPEWKGNL
ncbi:MAG TPA: flagellar basal body P-ring formation chaperone FlgA [Bryobacteraceae bacterium]|nr:flagellar basal body P-ring formation chaperone FlgA [Bryobacteraceae bacterium]